MIENNSRAIPKRTLTLLWVILVIAIGGVYLQTAGNEFVNYDDPLYVTENSQVSAGFTKKGVLWAFTTTHAANWHPITWLSHMLDVQLFGVNPAAHHLTSVFLHVANSLLLFSILRRNTGALALWKSFFVALLFGLHPLHVESVAWVAERKDVLSTLFGLLTILAYNRYVNNRSGSAYVLALGFFALGLMAKPMLVTLPFVLLLWDLWPLRRFSLTVGEIHSFLSILKEKLPFMAMTLASCVMTYYAQQTSGAVATMKAVPLEFRIINGVISYWCYLSKLIFPHNLAVMYPLPPTRTLFAGTLASIGLIGTLFITSYFRKPYPFLLVGWLWFLGTLVPVIGLVQVGEQAMADRYTYVPSIGFFLMLVWGGSALAHRYRPGIKFITVLIIAIGTALIPVTWVQVSYWQNSVKLFSHANQIVPESVTVLRLLGAAYAERKDFNAAAVAFQKALRLSPNDGGTHAEWGYALQAAGEREEAIMHYREAVRINPRHVAAHINLASLLLEKNNLTEALYHYQKAQDLDPDNPEIAFQLGMALGIAGDLAQAEVQFARALKLKPDFSEAHYNLGVTLAKKGRFQKAGRHFEDALRINPSLREARDALESVRLRLRESR